MLARSKENSIQTPSIPSISFPSEPPIAISNAPAESGVSQERLEELAQAMVDFKLASLAEGEKTDRLLRRLHNRTRWLAVLGLLSVLGLGGLGASTTYFLYSGYTQQQKSIESIAATPPIEANKIEQLETQVRELGDRLATYDEQFAQLQTQVETVMETARERQQSLAALARSLQDLALETVGNAETPPATTQLSPAPETPAPELPSPSEPEAEPLP